MLYAKFSAVLAGAAALGAVALVALPASADVIFLGPFATVTLTDNGTGGVSVVVQASATTSLKTGDGSDVFFNPTVSLTANSFEDLNGTVGTVSSNGPTLNGLMFNFKTSQNVGGLGTFAVDLQAIGTGQVGNTASVASYDFTVLNVTVAELEGTNAAGNTFGAHICDAPGTSCSNTTFFAGSTLTSTTTTNTSPIPEPGTLALLGSALAGLGFLRRRKSV